MLTETDHIDHLAATDGEEFADSRGRAIDMDNPHDVSLLLKMYEQAAEDIGLDRAGARSMWPRYRNGACWSSARRFRFAGSGD